MSRRDPDSAAELVRAGGLAAERLGGLALVRAWIRAAVVENASLKLVALFLSLTMFILVQSNEDEIVPVSVSVRYAAPRPGLTLVDEPPRSVRVSVRGSRRRLKRLKESELDPIQVTLTNTGEFVIQPTMVRPLPEGVEVASISPASISLRYENTGDKSVSIRARTVGAPEKGFRVERIVVSPESLDIRGAESALARIEELSTQPVLIEGARRTMTKEIELAVPMFPVEVVVNKKAENPVSIKVTVRVEIGAAPFRLETEGRQVLVLPAPGVDAAEAAGWRVEPSVVKLVLRGEEGIAEGIDLDNVQVGVRLHAADVIAKVGRQAEVVVRGVPDGVAVEKTPGEVRLIPK